MKVLWFRSHLVWLVFEGSITTCGCFHSTNFFDFTFSVSQAASLIQVKYASVAHTLFVHYEICTFIYIYNAHRLSFYLNPYQQLAHCKSYLLDPPLMQNLTAVLLVSSVVGGSCLCIPHTVQRFSSVRMGIHWIRA